MQYLARHDWHEALIYIRNTAGIELWECKVRGNRAWRQYLRQRKPAELRVKLDLPRGAYTARIYDLDAQQVKERTVRAGDTMALGVTDHDFAVLLNSPDLLQ